jgi:hypothetical protein
MPTAMPSSVAQAMLNRLAGASAKPAIAVRK